MADFKSVQSPCFSFSAGFPLLDFTMHVATLQGPRTNEQNTTTLQQPSRNLVCH